MNRLGNIFFTLLRSAIWDKAAKLPYVPTEKEWNDIYTISKEQTVTGILLDAISKLPATHKPPRKLILEWIAVQKFIEKVMEEDSAVIFNGNGYSEVWQKEAERRGLPNAPATPDAVTVYSSPEVVELCEKYHVFSRQELKAREDIGLEQYLKTLHTEASLAIRMARTQIYPAAVR